MSHRLIVLTLGIVLLSACTSGVRDAAPLASAADPRLAALPFPSDRAVSATTNYTLDGIVTDSQSPGAAADGNSLQLISAANMEWAIYKLTPSGSYPLQNAAVNFDFLQTTGAFVGVAGYTDNTWQFSGPYVGPATVPLASEHLSPAGNVWVAVVVSDGSAAKVDTVTVGETTPDPPTAVLTTLTPKVNPFQTLSLDAAGSSTSNGTIDDYEWDLDGDGMFSVTADEIAAHGSATADVVMGANPTEFDAHVRVTDTLGLQADGTQTVTAVGWLVVNIDASNGAGEFVSLAQINGTPGIAYNDASTEHLKYAYTADPEGGSGWATLTVDNGNTVGHSCSLAEVNGVPAIAHLDDLAHDLEYAYSTTADGSSGWNNLTLFDPSEIDYTCSLAVVGGKPAISYFEATGGSNGNLSYAYSTSDDGSSGWSKVVASSGDSTGRYSSLANFNGQPGIAYSDYSLGFYYLKFAANPNSDGSGAWSTEQISSETLQPEFVHLVTLADGNPAATYRGFNASLFYAHSDALTGGAWSKNAIQPINTGNNNDLCLIGGTPAISTQGSDSSLQFGATPDADGSSGWSFGAVGSQTVLGNSTSIAEIDGRPGLAHRGAGGLYYASLFE